MKSEVVRQAEAAGLYVESHTGRVEFADYELVCGACQKVLMPLPAGSMIFSQTHGSCTCSWGCCDASRPTNRPHSRHLEHRRKG